VREIAEKDGSMATWWGTEVECHSAFARVRREGVVTADEEDALREMLDILSETWTENEPSEEIRRLSMDRRTINSEPVDFATVANLDHPDGQFGILYRIDDAVIPLANAIFLLTGELFASSGPWIFGKVSYPNDDPLQVVIGNAIEVLPDRILEKYTIDGHWP
jgi:hypothetical protein